MTDVTEPKPCEKYHPLPCGLDVDCEVTVKYFDPQKSNEEIWKDYQEATS